MSRIKFQEVFLEINYILLYNMNLKKLYMPLPPRNLKIKSIILTSIILEQSEYTRA